MPFKSKAQRRKFAQLLVEGKIVLADEVYERLVVNGPIAPSFARVAEGKDRLVVVNSFSKTYNMTGWPPSS